MLIWPGHGDQAREARGWLCLTCGFEFAAPHDAEHVERWQQRFHGPYCRVTLQLQLGVNASTQPAGQTEAFEAFRGNLREMAALTTAQNEALFVQNQALHAQSTAQRQALYAQNQALQAQNQALQAQSTAQNHTLHQAIQQGGQQLMQQQQQQQQLMQQLQLMQQSAVQQPQMQMQVQMQGQQMQQPQMPMQPMQGPQMLQQPMPQVGASGWGAATAAPSPAAFPAASPAAAPSTATAMEIDPKSNKAAKSSRAKKKAA